MHVEQSVTGTVHRSGYFHSVVRGPKFVRALGMAIGVYDDFGVYLEDKRIERRSSGQEMARDKRIGQGEKSERLSPSVTPVCSVLLHHTFFPLETLQAYLRPTSSTLWPISSIVSHLKLFCLEITNRNCHQHRDCLGIAVLVKLWPTNTERIGTTLQIRDHMAELCWLCHSAFHKDVCQKANRNSIPSPHP